MKRWILILLLTVVSVAGYCQNERKHIRSGNKIFMEALRDTNRIDTARFGLAETEYRKALNKKPFDTKWNFNLADAIYKQQRFDEAAGKFSDLVEKMDTPEEKAKVLHNLGNSQLMNSKIDESIETYKKALRKNPTDLDTKYNLAYAQMLKKMQQQQQQQQQQNQDKQQQNQDQNKDQNKDQQNKDNKDQQDKNQQQQQQQQQNKISKENAEQLLQALQNDERQIQDKVKKMQAIQAKRVKTEKEW